MNTKEFTENKNLSIQIPDNRTDNSLLFNEQRLNDNTVSLVGLYDVIFRTEYGFNRVPVECRDTGPKRSERRGFGRAHKKYEGNKRAVPRRGFGSV